MDISMNDCGPDCVNLIKPYADIKILKFYGWNIASRCTLVFLKKYLLSAFITYLDIALREVEFNNCPDRRNKILHNLVKFDGYVDKTVDS